MKNNFYRIVPKNGYNEVHIQVSPDPHEKIDCFVRRTAGKINESNARIVRATFFGSLSQESPTLKVLKAQFSEFDFPVSWIEGANCNNSFINGLYIFAVDGVDVSSIIENNVCVGSIFSTEEAEYCYLGGLYSDADSTQSEQTVNILNTAQRLLNINGLGFENTVRTWYYLDNILDWYGDFNKARTAFFDSHGIFDKLVPASTGIEGKNPDNSKICLELTAIKPKTESFLIQKIPSPLQCSAEDYGSSFSRAIKYADNDHTYVTISGTASLDATGNVLHKNDPEKQIEQTFIIVEKILESQSFEFSDAVRAYAYLRDKSFADVFQNYLKKTGLDKKIGFICSENRVCWEHLLFEIEMDVVKKNS